MIFKQLWWICRLELCSLSLTFVNTLKNLKSIRSLFNAVRNWLSVNQQIKTLRFNSLSQSCHIHPHYARYKVKMMITSNGHKVWYLSWRRHKMLKQISCRKDYREWEQGTTIKRVILPRQVMDMRDLQKKQHWPLHQITTTMQHQFSNFSMKNSALTMISSNEHMIALKKHSV